MPRASAFGKESDGKKQLSIAQFLNRRPSADSAPSPSSPQAKPSPRKLLPPTSPRSPHPHATHSPRGLARQSQPSSASGLQSPRTINVDREAPSPQMTPRRTPVADGGVGRKSAWAQVGEDKVRTPKGRPLDCNMQMIVVSEDTIPELMDKLKHVEAADLGYDELSDDEESGAHVHIKGAATARRTRVLKGVKLDKTFEPPSHYIRTREVVDAVQITEYDMDSDDCHFVQKYNEACEDGKEVTFNVFEIMIDRLEKELMIRLEASQGGGHSNSERLGVRGLNVNSEHVTIDETVCAVCQYDDSYEDNLIIVCDGCDVAVHQVCYGVKKVPSGPWLCDPCSQGLRRTPKPPEPVCCLCHKKEGAFKSTDDGRWAHIMCAIWIPQTCVQNNETMSPIVGIDRVPQETWQLSCDFCLCQGACIRCSEPGCSHVFHPVCARSNGCIMDIGEGERGEIEYRATCPQHSDFASSSASSFAFERHSEEVVLEPQIIRDMVPIHKVFVAFQFKPHIVRCIYDYWVEKRARCFGSLLARFYTFPEGYFNSYRDEKTRKTNVLTLMKKAIKLREEWESLRILLDVVRQREKRKLALLKLQQEIVEEEVAVGWRTVHKVRVSVAAKWKVRPVKLQAVRAHHNFRSSSGSDSDEESSESGASGGASSSVCEDESGVSCASSETATAEDASDDGAVLSSSSNDSADEVSDLETPDQSAASAPGSAGIVRRARSGRSTRGNAEILKSMQRCAGWIQRSTGIKTKKLSERMLSGYGRGRRGGARAEWCRLCSAVVRFGLGTAVEGSEGLEAGLIYLAPGVTLGSLLQFEIPDAGQRSGHSTTDKGSDDVDEDDVASSLSSSSDEDSGDQESSEYSNDENSGKRKTRSKADKVSLELRGLGVKDGRAARQLASNVARPSRFVKRQKRASS